MLCNPKRDGRRFWLLETNNEMRSYVEPSKALVGGEAEATNLRGVTGGQSIRSPASLTPNGSSFERLYRNSGVVQQNSAPLYLRGIASSSCCSVFIVIVLVGAILTLRPRGSVSTRGEAACGCQVACEYRVHLRDRLSVTADSSVDDFSSSLRGLVSGAGGREMESNRLGSMMRQYLHFDKGVHR
jgi:hypothetical protein